MHAVEKNIKLLMHICALLCIIYFIYLFILKDESSIMWNRLPRVSPGKQRHLEELERQYTTRIQSPRVPAKLFSKVRKQTHRFAHRRLHSHTFFSTMFA